MRIIWFNLRAGNRCGRHAAGKRMEGWMGWDGQDGGVIIKRRRSVRSSTYRELRLCSESTWRRRLSLHHTVLRTLLKVHHFFIDQLWEEQDENEKNKHIYTNKNIHTLKVWLYSSLLSFVQCYHYAIHHLSSPYPLTSFYSQ